MITHRVEGDLILMLENSCKGITPPMLTAQGCNCFHVQRAGLAAGLSRFPQVLEADRVHGTRGDIERLGDFSYAHLGNSTLVFNLYTQYNYSRQRMNVDYSAIRSAFMRLNDISKRGEFEDREFYIPYIGAGLGGGDWDIISEYIDSATPDLDLTVVAYRHGVDPRLAPK